MTNMPARIERLPKTEKGMPIPYFVEYVGGKPDFRLIDGQKVRRCIVENRCFICGDKLGAFKSFVCGPIATMNMASAEPPSHRECAEFAVRVCPFIGNPRRERDEEGLPDGRTNPLVPFHNPGLYAVVTAKSYKMESHQGEMLLRIDNLQDVNWYFRGRLATEEETKAGLAKAADYLRNHLGA